MHDLWPILAYILEQVGSWRVVSERDGGGMSSFQAKLFGVFELWVEDQFLAEKRGRIEVGYAHSSGAVSKAISSLKSAIAIQVEQTTIPLSCATSISTLPFHQCHL